MHITAGENLTFALTVTGLNSGYAQPILNLNLFEVIDRAIAYNKRLQIETLSASGLDT